VGVHSHRSAWLPKVFAAAVLGAVLLAPFAVRPVAAGDDLRIGGQIFFGFPPPVYHAPAPHVYHYYGPPPGYHYGPRYSGYIGYRSSGHRHHDWDHDSDSDWGRKHHKHHGHGHGCRH
jgi:hypothetical protein